MSDTFNINFKDEAVWGKGGDPGDYVTHEELSEELNGYAKTEDIPDVSDFVKEEDLADYAKKSEIPDTSDFATKESLNDYIEKEWLGESQINPYHKYDGAYQSDYNYGDVTATEKSDGSVDVESGSGLYGVAFSIEINVNKTNRITVSKKKISGNMWSGNLVYFTAKGVMRTLGLLHFYYADSSDTYILTPEEIADKHLSSPVIIGFATNASVSYNISIKNEIGETTTISDIEKKVLKPLSGKNALFLGDSITALAAERGWTNHFKDITGCGEIANVAILGAVLNDYDDTVYDGNPSPETQHNNTLGNQVQKVINNQYDAPDLIIIAIGTNSGITADETRLIAAYHGSDGGATISPPLADLDKTHAEGAFRYCTETLHNLYPNALICWCNPIQSAEAVHTVKQVSEWADALETLTNWGAVYNIKTNRCGIFAAKEIKNSNGECLIDGLHPNVTGAERMGKYNAAAISAIFITR